MNTIGQHICYLLRHHDCVVLPGWGAFVAQRCPAELDTATGMVHPPMRVLSFNAAITHDDGLVASSVARRDRISYEQAMSRVNNAVETMNRTISVDHELVMPGLGRFAFTSEDALIFEPVKCNVVALPLMSFPPIPVAPVLETARAEAGASDSLRRGESYHITVSRNWMKIAASLLILIGLGLVLSTPIAIPDAARASLSAPAITFGQDEDDTDIFALDEANNHGVLSIVIPQAPDAMAVVDTVPRFAEPVPEPAQLRLVDTDRYCVVVASLASRELAREYVDCADIPMKILEKDGKYRVYAATETSSSRALDAIRDARLADRFPGAWVCHR